MRKLSNINDNEGQKTAIEDIERRLSPSYSASRPPDPSRGVYSSQTRHRNYKEYLSEEELNNKFSSLMKSSLTGYNSKNVSSRYWNNALSWLLKQELSWDQKENILSNLYDRLVIVGDESEIVDWIQLDLEKNSRTYERWGHRTIHSQLTLSQLNKLKTIRPKLLSCSDFIQSYLKKLMPLELGIYIGKSWKNEIPLKMKWKYIKTLYDYINGPDIQNANYR